MLNETAFERRRGVGTPEIRVGFAQVLVKDSPSIERVTVLRGLADAQVRMDFFKLTDNGFQFLVSEPDLPEVRRALSERSVEFEVQPGRQVVHIPAVNIRDEDGLIADLVAVAIQSGASISHLGDRHDRLLIVTDNLGAELIRAAIDQRNQAESR